MARNGESVNKVNFCGVTVSVPTGVRLEGEQQQQQQQQQQQTKKIIKKTQQSQTGLVEPDGLSRISIPLFNVGKCLIF